MTADHFAVAGPTVAAQLIKREGVHPDVPDDLGPMLVNRVAV
jgi:hypothetical protein